MLHPSIRLTYFEDTSKWDESVAIRARVLLEHLYEIYKEDTPVTESSVPKPSMVSSIFLDTIRNVSPTQQKAVISELQAYFIGTNPCLDGDALKWWKVNLNLLYWWQPYWPTWTRLMLSTIQSLLVLPGTFWQFPVSAFLSNGFSQAANTHFRTLAPL